MREGRRQPANLLLQTSDSVSCVLFRELMYVLGMICMPRAGSNVDDDFRSVIQVHLSLSLSVPASSKDGPHRKGHLRRHPPITFWSAKHVCAIRRNVSMLPTYNPSEPSPPGHLIFQPGARRQPFYLPLPNAHAIIFDSRGLYRWKSDRDKVHYFVEFTKAEGVNRARSSKLNVPDTHVHALVYIPQLIDRFCALASAAGDPVPDIKRSRSSSPRRPSTGRTRRTSLSRSRETSPHAPTAFCPAFGDPGFTLRAPGYGGRRSPSRGLPLSVNSETRPETAALSPISISLSDSSLATSFVSEHTPRTGRHTLTLTVCDQPITVNLEASEDDPKGIISLLELSTCERDKWIVVAAHYRRGGNPVAAINVLTSMMKGDPPPIFCFSLRCTRPES